MVIAQNNPQAQHALALALAEQAHPPRSPERFKPTVITPYLGAEKQSTPKEGLP